MIAGLEDISGGTLADRRPARQRRAAGQARHGDGVPELRALSAHDGGREHGLRAEARGHAEAGSAAGAWARAAEILRISHLLQRKPKALSGGQRQRVAIGRAIVRKPEVFLFDEPLSNLDAALRVQMRLELSSLHRELGTTMIYVTHDQVEAMTMGDRIAVFNAGRIEQVGRAAGPVRPAGQPLRRRLPRLAAHELHAVRGGGRGRQPHVGERAEAPRR